MRWKIELVGNDDGQVQIKVETNVPRIQTEKELTEALQSLIVELEKKSKAH